MVAVKEKINRPHRARDSVNGVGNFAADFLQSNAQSSFLADSYGSVAQETSGSIIKNYTYRADARTSGFQSGNLSANYFFDALDRRIAKSFNDNGQQYTQSYLFQDKEDRVLLAKAGNGDIYTYIDGQGIDEHLGHINGITAKYYVTDHLGSVLNTEAAGVGKTFGYSGEVVSTPALSPSSNPSIYGFAGGTHNQESNTITFGVRDYDANTGRWNSQEPLGMDGPNLYWYARNNSIRYIDNNGYSSSSPVEGASPISGIKGVNLVVDSFVREAKSNDVLSADSVNGAYDLANNQRKQFGVSNKNDILASNEFTCSVPYKIKKYSQALILIGSQSRVRIYFHAGFLVPFSSRLLWRSAQELLAFVSLLRIRSAFLLREALSNSSWPRILPIHMIEKIIYNFSQSTQGNLSRITQK